MAEELSISTGSLSSSSSFSISSPDSTASSTSSDDIADTGNSSWGFPPPPMPDGNGGPHFHMKSLRPNLPSQKRGLSNFYNGKSQSFRSLSDVKCVEELAKSEKKIKSSYSWESMVKPSYNNKHTIRSSILSASSATNSYRRPLSSAEQIVRDSYAGDNRLSNKSISNSEC
eukprot:PITA_36229